jgi:hypothetical protein
VNPTEPTAKPAEPNAKVGIEPEADPAKPKVPQAGPSPGPEPQGVRPVEVIDVTIEQANPRVSLTPLDVTISVLAFLGWVCLVAAGVAISSKHYIDNLGAPTKHAFWVVVGSGLVVATCHVVPNIALLSCLAAYLGVLASRTLPGETGRPPDRDSHKAAFTTAITRGFYVYLLILSGSVLFSSEGFGQWATHDSSSAADAADYETYTRLAGLASLVSFTAGYNPELFKFLLARVSQWQTNQQATARPAGADETAPGRAARPRPSHDNRAGESGPGKQADMSTPTRDARPGTA